MRRIPVVIDCDPGVDDIAALLLAKNIEHFDIRAVTTVAGNVPLEDTTRNALQLLSFMSWDIPTGRGAEKPLAQRLVTAEEVHGKGGMSGLTLPETYRRADAKPAWDLMYDAAREHPGRLDIIALGPLTNLAIALMKYPRLVEWVRRIVIMGGGILTGNTTPAAEFNIYVDPEAAKRVFTSGISFYLCPLDVTHEGYVTREDIAEIGSFDSKEARFFAEVIGRGFDIGKLYTKGRGVALHDPLALLFAADDSYFTMKECFIDVETGGSFTRGKTVSDCYSDQKMSSNGFLVQGVDRERFVDHIKRLLLRY